MHKTIAITGSSLSHIKAAIAYRSVIATEHSIFKFIGSEVLV